jgi:hypothetical protein
MRSRFTGASIAAVALLVALFAVLGADITNAAEPTSAAPGRADDAFASLGYAPMPGKASPRNALAAAPASPPDNNILIFGGQFTTDTILKSLNPFSVHHENQHIVAAAFGHDFYRAPYGFVFGGEIGLGVRFGMGTSEELWGGVSIRHAGFDLFGLVRVGGAIIVRFSGITNPTGKEALRHGKDPNGSARFLGYLAPELTIALPPFPNWEFAYRLHHRSGLYGLIAANIEGANANVFGIRYRF